MYDTAKQFQHCSEWHKNVPVDQSHFEKVEVERAKLHPKSFKCPVCSMSFKNVTSDGKEFLDEPALYKHMDIHHTSLLSSCKLKACKYCGLILTGIVDYFPNFITHKRKCHGFGSSAIRHICDDDFVPSTLLNTHLSTAHQQTSLLTCDFCPFEAENCDYEGMHQHKLVRHGIAKKHAEFTVPPIKSSAKVALNLLRKTNVASNIQYPASKNPIVARETEKILKPCQNRKLEATGDESRTEYSCPMCPQKLAPMSVFAFFQHIAFHQQRPNKCTECQIYLPSSDDAINTHWNESHTDSPTTPRTTLISLKLGDVWEAWECRFCDNKFSSDDERELHEAKLHRKGVISKTLPKSFCSMLNWQFHRVLAHPTDFELSCFYCNERFPIMTIEGVEILDSNARKQHVLKEHSNLPSIPQFDVCRYCGQCFSGFIALSSHLLEEHKVDEDNLFQCSMCSSSFKHPEEFHAHVKTHQQDPVPVQICDVCGWTCNNSSRKRGRESEFRFHQHRFRQHGILPPDKFPVLKCDVEGCPFQTVNPERFKNHKGVHLPQSERPYQCKECGKGFSDGSKLNVHMNIHKNANSKPFQCELCGNSFAVRNYLYIHMRLSHEGRFFPSTHKKKKPRKKKPKTTQSSTELPSEAECMDVNLLGNNSSENQETVPNSTSVISESVSISVQLDS
ncbi:putative zinc finger protein [Orchesella cincta]|uniref:Putative zinc finger protein n=1 Tax=Orchesella cincta TaxID=48709 RepID=A0A1D2MAG3_ORCCI|nr:putative zinc finger protein [Orchesella cincta]